MDGRLVLMALGLAACGPPIVGPGAGGHTDAGHGSGAAGGASVGTGGSSGAGGAGGGCVPGSAIDCYDGPPGTAGVGLCRAGTMTCDPGGKGYGPCEGQVLPAPEDCATPVDEDCDGLAPACTGKLLWSERFGASGEQDGRALAVDAAGNVIVVGTFVGTIDLGGGALGGSTTVSTVFAAKLDPAGHHVWSRSFGGMGSAATGVAVDAQGDVVVTGTFTDGVDFGGGPLHGTAAASVFVAKLGPGGAYRWSRGFGDSGQQGGTGVAVDGAGNVIVTGTLGGAADFGGGPLQSAGLTDVFVASFDAAGHHRWSKRFGDAGAQTGRAVAVDGAGSVVVTGHFQGSIDFGAGPLQSAGGDDVFLARFATNGQHLWSERFGDASDQGGSCVAVDAAGNVILAGYLGGAADFGGGPLQSAGDADVFVAKLTSTGDHLWSRRFGDGAAQTANAIALDTHGNPTLLGDFLGAVDFGGGPLQSAGGGDVFVAKLDVAGEHLWSKRFGDAGGQSGQAIATDGADGVLLLGYFTGAIDLGGGELASAGGNDVFVARLAP